MDYSASPCAALRGERPARNDRGFEVTHRTLFFTLGSIVFASAVGAADPPARRPMTVEDLWSMQRVGGPALSPDGSLVAFTVSSFSMEENKGNPDLWLVPVDGTAPPRRLTTNDGPDGSARWSPDGRKLAFLSKRSDGPSQIYLLPIDGGEAERLTDLPMAVDDLRWFPDGEKIAFLASTWPDLNGDFTAVKARLDEREKDKVKAIATENRLYRYWDRWLTDGRFPHLYALDLATRKIVDLTPGAARLMALTDGGGGGGWDISPDGAEIAFSANATAAPYFSLNYDIFVIPSGGGDAVNLTPDNPAEDSGPRYAPDGRHLLYGRNLRPETPPEFMRVVRRDRHSGQVAELAPGWDVNASAWTFTSDGATVVVQAERSGRENLWTVPVTGGTPREILTGGTLGGAEAGPGGTLVYTRHSVLHPSEIFTARIDGSGERALTTFNREILALLDLGAVEDVRFPGAAGAEVQMFVVYPPGFTPARKWPLLQLLHGGPHNSWTDGWHWRWNAALFAAKGYVCVGLNFHGSMGEGQAFAESIMGAHGDKPFDDVMKSTDAMIARGFTDETRMAVLGGSYGGYLTAWTTGQTSRFKAAVVHAGVYDLMAQMASDVTYGRLKNYGATPWEDPVRIDRWSPNRFASGFTTPTLVVHGERDYRVPVTQGLELYGVLQAKGVPSRLLVYQDENHWVLKPQSARLWWNEVFGWLERWMPAP